jgi:hypothetical protein
LLRFSLVFAFSFFAAYRARILHWQCGGATMYVNVSQNARAEKFLIFFKILLAIHSQKRYSCKVFFANTLCFAKGEQHKRASRRLVRQKIIGFERGVHL